MAKKTNKTKQPERAEKRSSAKVKKKSGLGKKGIAVILCAVIILTGAGVLTTLGAVIGWPWAAPVNLVIEENTLKWKGSGKSFVVESSGSEYPVDEKKFDLTTLNCPPDMLQSVRVKKSGSDKYSDELRFVFGQNGYADAVEEGNASNEIIQLGIAQGINTLSATSIDTNNLKFENQLFKTADLNNIGTLTYNTNRSESSTISSEQISEIMNSLNRGLSTNMSVSAQKGMFSGEVSSKFKIDTSIKSTFKSYQYYHVYNHFISDETVMMNDYLNAERYASALTQNALSDIAAVDGGAMTVDAFFQKYGTHILMKANFGGKLETYYSVFASEELSHSTINSEISAAMSMAVNGLIVSAKGSYEINLFKNSENNSKENLARTNLSVKKYGGANFAAASFEQLSSGYKQWADSFNDPATKQNTLIGVGYNGLVPVWEYLPPAYSSLKDSMQKYFDEQAENNYNGLLNLIKPASAGETIHTQQLVKRACADNKGYNPANGVSTPVHDNWSIGEIIVENCSFENSKFSPSNGNGNIKLNFRLKQTINNLGAGVRPSEYTYCAIFSDAYSGQIYDTEINGEGIGYGAYYVFIKYKGTGQVTKSKTNVLYNLPKESDINLLSGVTIDSDKQIEYIRVNILYEIKAIVKYKSSFFPVMMEKEEFSNWNDVCVIKFA